MLPSFIAINDSDILGFIAFDKKFLNLSDHERTYQPKGDRIEQLQQQNAESLTAEEADE
ncbi:hypothetical protein NO365_04429 (plasmid) [Planktothrix agardhii]|jgi:hypothetical protein|nr:hypothetical protein NO365_04429 [Planktothrix agardhii]